MGNNTTVVDIGLFCESGVMHVIRDAQDTDFVDIDRLVVERLPYLTRPPMSVWPQRCTNVRRAEGNLLLVASTLAGQTVGFLWADARGADGYPRPLPWWCINMVAVDEAFQGNQIGNNLLQTAYRRMKRAGVVSIYGMCRPELADWYRLRGFDTTAPGGQLESSVRLPSGRSLPMVAAPNECLFLADGDTEGTPFLCLE